MATHRSNCGGCRTSAIRTGGACVAMALCNSGTGSASGRRTTTSRCGGGCGASGSLCGGCTSKVHPTVVTSCNDKRQRSLHNLKRQAACHCIQVHTHTQMHLHVTFGVGGGGFARQ